MKHAKRQVPRRSIRAMATGRTNPVTRDRELREARDKRIAELEAQVAHWKKLCGEFEAQRNELEEHNEELEADLIDERDRRHACEQHWDNAKAERDKLASNLIIAVEQRNGYASQRNDLANELEELEAERDDLKVGLREAREIMGESSRGWKETCQAWEDGCKEAQAERNKLREASQAVIEAWKVPFSSLQRGAFIGMAIRRLKEALGHG